jgi:hypothetical protein
LLADLNTRYGGAYDPKIIASGSNAGERFYESLTFAENSNYD